MRKATVPYLTEDFELVKDRSANILTLNAKDTSELLRSRFANEVDSLAEIFRDMKSKTHNKWADAILANLPVDVVERDEHKGKYIRMTKIASLRFLSCGSGGDQIHLDDNVFSERSGFFKTLLDASSVDGKNLYESMLNFVPADECGSYFNSLLEGIRPEVDSSFQPQFIKILEEHLKSDLKYPFNSDTEFGYCIFFIETQIDYHIKLCEAIWRKDVNWQDYKSTPPEILMKIAEKLFFEFKKTIDRWFIEGKCVAKAYDILSARLSVNISANRALLEWSAKDYYGLLAADMNVEFLKNLNRVGITSVPDDVFDIEENNAVIKINAIFKEWFGYGGKFVESDKFFNRALNPSDIELVLAWAQSMSRTYLQKRNTLEVHSQPQAIFRFGLTVIAAFYCKTRVARELKGSSNSTYSVFPDRAVIGVVGSVPIPAHSLELLHHAYGQMFFGCDGDDINHQNIHMYASMLHDRRVRIQDLIIYATKYRECGEVLALFNNLKNGSSLM